MDTPDAGLIARLLLDGLIDQATASELLGPREPVDPVAALRGAPGVDAALLDRVQTRRLAAAVAWKRSSRAAWPAALADLPCPQRGWPKPPAVAAGLPRLVAEWLLLRNHDEALPEARRLVEEALDHATDALPKELARRDRLPRLLADLDWPALAAAEAIPTKDTPEPSLAALAQASSAVMALAVWPQDERATLLCAARFGSQAGDAIGWRTWLMAEGQRQESLVHLPHPERAALAWLLLRRHGADEARLRAAAGKLAALTGPATCDGIATRWRQSLPATEWRILMGMQQPSPARPSRQPPKQVTADGATTAEPPSPPAPDWLVHLKGFLDDHWALLAGGLMVVAGTALLAYYTWDKHWLLRYSLLPGILLALTAAVGWTGGWLERREAGLAGTAAILRALAIVLLPAHALVPALLAADEAVGARWLVVPLALAAYGAGMAWMLRRWCAGVHVALRGPLPPALLSAIALVAIGPLATVLGWTSSPLPLLTIATYGAAAWAAWAVHRYTRALAEQENLRQEHIAWFVGGTLVATLAHALIWAYGLVQAVPEPVSFSLLVCGLGWLVLLVERRSAWAAGTAATIQGASFLGFAGLLGGIALGMGDPRWRIVVLAAAAAAWLDQARGRDDRRQWAIGSLLLAAAGLSLAALPELAHAWRGPLMVAVGTGLLAVAGSARPAALVAALRGSAVAALVAAVAASVVIQWHQATPAWLCGITVATAAVIMAVHACRRDDRRLALVAACTATVALPYLGCVDLNPPTLHGNHLVAGFSILGLLWLLASRLPGAATLRHTRCLVGLALGALTVAALLVRVGLEAGRPGEWSAWHLGLDYGGALAMTALLVLVSWWSRSLIPGLLATLVLVILIPELRGQFIPGFDPVVGTSGLGAVLTALVFAGLLTPLRRAAWLRDLGPGEELLAGRPFPWRRFDHTLLTWPLLAAASFLVARTDTVTLVRRFAAGDGLAPWPTMIALFLSVPVWLLLAGYRGPHGLGEGLPRRLRPVWALAAGYALAATMVTVLHRLWPELARQWQVVIPLLAVTVLGWGLCRLPWWSQRLAGRRLLQTTTRFAVAVGGLGLLGLATGSHPATVVGLLATAAAFAAVDAVRHAKPGRGAWAWTPVLAGLLAWALRSGTPVADDPLWLLHVGSQAWPPLLLILAGIGVTLLLREGLLRCHPLPRLERGLLLPLAGWFLGLLLPVMLVVMSLVGNGIAEPAAGWWWLLVALAALAAWSQTSWALALVAVTMAWWGWLRGDLLAAADDAARATVVLRPLTMAILGCLAAALPAVVHTAARRLPLLAARQPALVPPGGLAALDLTALVTSGLSIVLIWLFAPFRDHPSDLVGAALCGLPALLVLVQGRWKRSATTLAVVGLAMGNVQAVRILAGTHLLDLGLHRTHLVMLGLAATALELSGLARLRSATRSAVRLANLGLAGLLLLLVAGNYAIHPDLGDLTWSRLLVSLAAAVIAGRAFRHLAHGAVDATPAWRAVGTAGYHAGLALALTCAALMIPALRHPQVALVALALPVMVFYLRAERDPAGPWRSSTELLAGGLLFLSLFRPAFTLLLYPESAGLARAAFYHGHAPLLIGLGLILLRCVGLGGDRLWSLAGGLAVMVGLFFGVTAWPGLSPFTDPLPAAWVAIVLAHLLTLASDQRSPLRSGLLRLLAVDGPDWHAIRRQWGLLLTLGCHAAIIVALPSTQSVWQACALLVGGASLLLHHAAVRQGRGHAWLGLGELLLAVHVLPLDDLGTHQAWAAWAVAVIWAVLIGLHHGPWAWLRERLVAIHPLTVTVLAVLMLLHLFVAGPASGLGLGLAAALLVLGAATPCRAGRLGPWLLPLTLGHLAAWAMVAGGQPWSAGGPWVVLATLLAGFGALAVQLRARPALTVGQAASAGERLLICLQGLSADAVAVAQGTALTTAGILTAWMVLADLVPGWPLAWLLPGLALYLAWFWYQEGERRRAVWCLVLSQVAVAVALAAIRHHLRLTVPGYTIVHDVWAGLLLSTLVAGGRSLWENAPRHVHLPLAWSAVVLPLGTLSWILLHGLGTDLALIAILLHSVGFTYVGRGSGGRPFQALAVVGFTALFLLAAWSKLDLRVLPAFVVPAGIGLLALVQFFRDRLRPEAANGIRSTVVVTMLAASAWHAVADASHPLVFHAILAAVALGVLLTGAWMHIRVYAALGFAGIALAVGSLMVHGFGHLERGVRMSLIGAVILLAGTGLIAGVVILKARREQILALAQRWKERFEGWE